MSRSSQMSLRREKLFSLGMPIECHTQAKHYAGVMQGLGMAAPQIEAAMCKPGADGDRREASGLIAEYRATEPTGAAA